MGCSTRQFHTQAGRLLLDELTYSHFDALVASEFALANCEAVVAKHKSDPSTYQRAIGQFQAGQFGAARRSLLELLAAYPHDADLLRLAGATCSELGRHDEAIGFLSQVASGRPSAQDLYNLGKALQLAGRFAEALRAHHAGLQIAPRDARLLQAKAATLHQLGRYNEAIQAFVEVLRSGPANAEALANLGLSLREAGRGPEALEQLRAAAQLDPTHAATLVDLVGVALGLCDWDGFEDIVKQVWRLVDRGKRVDPFVLLTIVDDPRLQASACRLRAAAYEAQAAGGFSFSSGKQSSGRIRLGYVSADFRDHAVSRCIAGLLETHDRDKFDITAVSLSPDDGSAMRQRVSIAVDRFVDIHDADPRDQIERVRALDLDIAVDLMGHTRLANMGLFANRIAPVQVTYLGYPGTSALRAMDYIILDPVIGTREVVRHLAEAPVFMPNSYQVNDHKRPLPREAGGRSEHGLPEDATVLCCFNKPNKLTPAMFDCWMRILEAAPRAILWIFAPSPEAAQNLKAAAIARGLDPARLVVAGKAGYDEYLARYLLADLFLDTFPYGAHGTGSDALWMGCPVLTLTGRGFASRVCSSLLSAAGLQELAVESLAQYERLAITLVNDRARLAALRRHLEEGRDSAPLFDTPLFARNLESAYVAMHSRHLRGQKPHAIHISMAGPHSRDQR